MEPSIRLTGTYINFQNASAPLPMLVIIVPEKNVQHITDRALHSYWRGPDPVAPPIYGNSLNARAVPFTPAFTSPPCTQVQNELPVSAIPFTLRSSSLKPFSEDVEHSTMPEPPKRGSSIGIDSSRWAPKVFPQVTLNSMNPAANLSGLSIHSNTSTLVNADEPSQASHPPHRQLINSLTGEVVVPRTFEARESSAEDRWKQHNKDFMAHARGLVNIQSQGHKLKSPHSGKLERVDEQSSQLNATLSDEPTQSTVMNSSVKIDETQQKRLASKPEYNEANVAQILTHMNGIKVTSQSPSAGKSMKSPPSHSSIGNMAVNGDHYDLKETQLANIQVYLTNQQNVVRDIVEKVNASRKVIHEASESIHTLHRTLLQSVVNLQTTINDMNKIDESLQATSTSFINMTINPELESSLRSVLETRPKRLDGAKLIDQIHGLISNKQIVGMDQQQKKTAEVKHEPLEEGVYIKQEHVESTLGQTVPSKHNGVTNGNHKPGMVLGKGNMGSTTPALETSRESIDSVTANLPQIDYSQVRKVKLSNLPNDCTLKDIAKVIWGGRILVMSYEAGEDYCSALFLLPDGCKNYYESTRQGIPWPCDPGRLIRIDRSVHADVPNEYQLSIANTEVTRCVRLVGIPSELGQEHVRRFAEGSGRTLESIIVGKDGSTGRRAAEIRFSSMKEAVSFVSMVPKSGGFSGCEARFSKDPCEKAKGVHK